MEVNTIVQMDALEFLRGIPDGAADAVICDPPYLTTDLAFDKARIDWAVLITECLRVVKSSGAVVMFAAMRTAVAMISAAPKYYRYDMVWHKTMPTGFPNAPLQPLRAHEHILVWSTGAAINGAQVNRHGAMAYYPVMGKGVPYKIVEEHRQSNGHYRASATSLRPASDNFGTRHPTSVITYSNGNSGGHHPTQKPLDLMSYLVRTYTRPDELVIDCFAGSGSTLVAARNTGRRYAGCDLDPSYVEIARRRLAEPYTPSLFPDEPAPTEPDAVQGDMFGEWE